MRILLAVLVLALLVLHQDYWNWSNGRLSFGFLPPAIAWHLGISIGASAVWYFATVTCWPESNEAQGAEAKGAETQEAKKQGGGGE